MIAEGISLTNCLSLWMPLHYWSSSLVEPAMNKLRLKNYKPKTIRVPKQTPKENVFTRLSFIIAYVITIYQNIASLDQLIQRENVFLNCFLDKKKSHLRSRPHLPHQFPWKPLTLHSIVDMLLTCKIFYKWVTLSWRWHINIGLILLFQRKKNPQSPPPFW